MREKLLRCMRQEEGRPGRCERQLCIPLCVYLEDFVETLLLSIGQGVRRGGISNSNAIMITATIKGPFTEHLLGAMLSVPRGEQPSSLFLASVQPGGREGRRIGCPLKTLGEFCS